MEQLLGGTIQKRNFQTLRMKTTRLLVLSNVMVTWLLMYGTNITKCGTMNSATITK